MIAQIIQLGVAYILLNSAVHKFEDRTAAWHKVSSLAPELHGPRGVGILAAAEAAIAVSLLVPAWAMVGLTASGWLLTTYSIVITRSMLKVGPVSDCGCSSGRAMPAVLAHYLRNLPAPAS